MPRESTDTCAACVSWPLRSAAGETAPPGHRTCATFERPAKWDSRACVLFKEDRALRIQRAAFIAKHSEGSDIG